MNKKSIIIWTDGENQEHAYLLEGKDMIDPESFVFHLRCHRTVKAVKMIPLESIRDEHATVIIRSLEPLPQNFGVLISAMKN